MLTAMANDVRYSLRSLAKSPGFTLAAVLTIALGIGVNTGIFSILNGLAFRDLPVPQARDLVAVNQRVEGVGRGTHNAGQASTFEYETFRDRSETLDGLIGYVGGWEAVLDGEFREEIVGSLVTCNYFDVLRLRPRLGPGLRAEHCENPSLSSVVILSHGLWSRHFGQDESIINRTVTLNGNAVTVVGVAPEGFDGTDLERADYFLPISAQALIRPDRDYLTNGVIAWLRMIGRRKPQATTEQVQAELAIIARQFDQAQPGRETTLTVQRATQVAVPGLRGPILSASAVIMTAFALVLLVACTNVANLFLVRGDNRARELAIRMSLGATRSALVRQLLTESLIVAVVGGVIGSLFALWAFRVLVTLALGALPGEVQSFLRIDPSPDVRVFLFAFAVSLATGLIFGLAPALRSTRPNLRTTIDRDTAATGSDTRGRLQRVLVGVQVAVCMVLVVTTALLLRGLYEAQTLEPGFDPEDLVVAAADLRGFGYEGERASAFQRQLSERVESLPGVESVAMALVTPLELRRRSYSYRVPERTEDVEIGTNVVSGNYFSVVGIPIVAGRSFTDAEAASDTTTAIVVTESTARRLWPNENPLGKTLVRSSFEESLVEVVGVAQDVQVSSIGESDTSYIYSPAIPATRYELRLVIRSPLGVTGLRENVQNIAAEIDSSLVFRVTPLSDNFELWRRLSRLAVALSVSLGALALALASIGILGVISAVVARRIREIGIRLALGAGRLDVLRLVLRKAMLPVYIGAAIGTTACFGVSRLVSGLLFGVSPLDPIALAGALLVVILAALLASFTPAQRAMDTDPMTTLRHE